MKANNFSEKLLLKVRGLFRQEPFIRLKRPILFLWFFYLDRLSNHLAKPVTPLFNIDTLDDRISEIDEIIDSGKHITFYKVARSYPYAGLFAYVTSSLSHVAYGIAKGMVPVIDMQTYPNPYLNPDEVGLKNAWEKYFKQPFGIGLAEISDKKHKRSSIFTSPRIYPRQYFLGKQSFDFWCKMYEKYLVLNEDAKLYIDREYDALIKKDMRVLGVMCRGTDYVKQQPKNHPKQPKIEDLIEAVRVNMRQWECDYIYLTTDEKKAVDIFKENFPDKVITNSKRYYDEFDMESICVTQAKFERENDAFLQGLEYLSSIVILSRCNCLVAGYCGGTMGALYMNNKKYENVYIFDLGVY